MTMSHRKHMPVVALILLLNKLLYKQDLKLAEMTLALAEVVKSTSNVTVNKVLPDK